MLEGPIPFFNMRPVDLAKTLFFVFRVFLAVPSVKSHAFGFEQADETALAGLRAQNKSQLSQEIHL